MASPNTHPYQETACKESVEKEPDGVTHHTPATKAACQLVEDASKANEDIKQQLVTAKGDKLVEDLSCNKTVEQEPDAAKSSYQLGKDARTAIEDIKLSIKMDKASMREIDLSGAKLTNPKDMAAVASALGTCKYFKRVSLGNCDLTSESFSELATGLLKSSVKVYELDISGNINIGAGIASICEIIQHCKVWRVVAKECKLGPKHMEIIQLSLQDCKIAELDISGNPDIGLYGISSVGEIAQRCKVEKLWLRDCNINKPELEQLSLALGDWKLTELDIGLSQKKRTQKRGRTLSVRKTAARPRPFSQALSPPLGTGIVEFVDESCDSVDAIKPILEKVSGNVLMQNWEMDEAAMKKMKKQLDNKKLIGLKINCGEETMKTVETTVLSTKRKKVSPKGDTIEMSGCKATFPARALPEDTEINVSMDYDPPKLDKGYVRVAPVIHCEPSGLKLDKPVKYVIDTWLAATPTNGQTDTNVHILHRENEDSDWVWFQTVPLRNGKAEFECDHFSFFSVVVETLKKIKEYLFPTKIRVKSLIFHDVNGNIFPFFCLDDDVLLQKHLEKLSQSQLSRTFPFSKTLKVPVEKTLVCSITLAPDGFTVAPGEYQLAITCDFDSDYGILKIEAPDNDGKTFDLACIIKSGRSELFNKSLRMSWPFVIPGNGATAPPGGQTTGNFVAQDNSTMHVHLYDGNLLANSGTDNAQNSNNTEANSQGLRAEEERLNEREEEEGWFDSIHKFFRRVFFGEGQAAAGQDRA